jgi:hypothetical protein
MNLNFADIAGQFLKAGAPVLAKVLGAALPFPLNLIASNIVGDVAGALGTEPTPQAIGAAIEKDPISAQEKLQSIEAKYASLLDFAKLQTDLNLHEAESPNLFVAGWRPAFGWLGVILAGYQTFAAASMIVPLVPADIFNPVWLAFGGLMGLRSTEKWAGVATETLKALPRNTTRKKA